jgi:hypothetical protein
MAEDIIYYADEPSMLEELKKYGSEGRDILTEATILRGKKRGNQQVKRYIINRDIDESNLPSEIVEAATLFAVSKVLDIIYSEKDTRSPAAKQNDEDAKGILEGWLLEPPSDEEAEEEGVIPDIGCFVIDGTLNDEEELEE